MSLSDKHVIRVGARGSRLSRVQVAEVFAELVARHPHVVFEPVWVETAGDLDLHTSLKMMGKSDFFTREIDNKQLKGEFSISIHSAKDLPDPLADGLCVVALTKGLDPADVLVMREGESVELLAPFSKIGTSSVRREKAIQSLRSDLVVVDVRGSIDQRLALLDACVLDGVVMAEAALIRLKLTHRNRIRLEGESAPYQGQLAVLARLDDKEMIQLFS